MTVRTGNTEPTWPEKKGAKLIEYSELDDTTLVAPPVTPTRPRLPPDLEERYGDSYWDPDTIVDYSP